MEPATFLDVFIAVISANGLTVWIAYSVWRMRRDESDTRNKITFLALLGFVGLALYASTTG
jgi:hypothetical protein